ncbi:response regulator [Streptomyces griseoruber]|uniref:response regulator n=1 Tax=Streptomyces griseoruber TaxID=1943 RepID=UPI00099E756F
MKVLVVDDHPVARRGLRAVVTSNLGECEILEADDATTALAHAHDECPEMILLDARMPESMPPEELCRELRESLPNVVIVIFTAFDDAEVLHACVAAGANGCLLIGNRRCSGDREGICDRPSPEAGRFLPAGGSGPRVRTRACRARYGKGVITSEVGRKSLWRFQHRLDEHAWDEADLSRSCHATRESPTTWSATNTPWKACSRSSTGRPKDSTASTNSSPRTTSSTTRTSPRDVRG